MVPSEPTELQDPPLAIYVERKAPDPFNHAWKMICGSIGFQLALLIMGNVAERTPANLPRLGWSKALVVPAVLAGTVLGVIVGCFADKPRRRRGSPSGLRHLFVLILQFALFFAWFKAWGGTVLLERGFWHWP